MTTRGCDHRKDHGPSVGRGCDRRKDHGPNIGPGCDHRKDHGPNIGRGCDRRKDHGWRPSVGRGCDRRKDHELFLRKTTLVVCLWSEHFGGVTTLVVCCDPEMIMVGKLSRGTFEHGHNMFAYSVAFLIIG